MSMLSRYATLATPAAANIRYVGGTTLAITGSTSTQTDVSLTSLSGGLATAPSAGDLVIVYNGIGSTSDRNTLVQTNGYTPVADLYSDDTYDANLGVYYKIMGASPDTVVRMPATGSTANAGAVVVQVWRGVDPLVPLDVVSTTATGTNGVLCNPPAITPATAGAVIVAGGAGAHTFGVQTYTSSDLSNFITVGGPNSTNDVTVGVGSYAWTSGAFNPATFGYSGTDQVSNSWAAVTLALRPNQNQAGPFLISQASAQVNGTALAINKPTGTREGDLMLAVMNSQTSVTWTGDTGWTEVADQGSGASTRIAYKLAGASEPASYTFTPSSIGKQAGTIATYRNAAYDAVSAISTSASLAAVTATVAFARIVSTIANTTNNLTITGPAAMETIALDADGDEPSRLVEQDVALSLAGSSGTRAFNASTGTISGALVALKPAASYTKYAQYLASTSGSATTGPGLTVNTPACVPGNLLLFVTSTAGSGATDISFSTPSGWTLLSGNSTSTTTFQPSMYIFYRIADGSEAASYTATASAGTSSLVGVMLTLAGVDASTLTAGTTSTGSSTTSITATEVTATANGILLYFGAQANSSAPVTFTPPSGMTEAIEQSNNATNADLTVTAAYQEGLSAGATGSKTGTASAAAGTNRFRAILVTVDAK
jgi:hypothetical protein